MSFGLNEDQFAAYFKGAVHGVGGVGKTRSLITAKDSLLINIENRVEGLRDHKSELNANHRTYTIDVEPEPGKTPLTKLLQEIDGPKGIVNLLKADKSKAKYKTIIIDSLSMIGDIIVKHKPIPRNEFDKWPQIQEMFYDIYHKFNDLEYNVIFLMQTKIGKKTIQDGKEKKTFDYYRPTTSINNNLDMDFGFKVENLYYMYHQGVGSAKRIILQTQESDVAYARNTKPLALPQLMNFNLSKENPFGWDEVFKRVKEYDDSAEGEAQAVSHVEEASE